MFVAIVAAESDQWRYAVWRLRADSVREFTVRFSFAQKTALFATCLMDAYGSVLLRFHQPHTFLRTRHPTNSSFLQIYDDGDEMR